MPSKTDTPVTEVVPQPSVVTPVVESPVNVATVATIEARMRERVVAHQENARLEIGRSRLWNPAIPNNPFEFSRYGLPADYEYFPVQVPSKTNERMNLLDSQTLHSYVNSGWQFLTTDLVTSDGKNGTVAIASIREENGRVILNGCFIMFASKAWYAARRDKADADADAKRRTQRDALKETGESRTGVSVFDETIDLTSEAYKGVTDVDDALDQEIRRRHPQISQGQ